MPVIFFGDEIADLIENLRNLRQSRSGTVLLQAFLEQATTVLREEIRAQPREFRYMVPSFTSVFDLAEHHHASGVPYRAIESALTFVCHLGLFIGSVRIVMVKFIQATDFYILDTTNSGRNSI